MNELDLLKKHWQKADKNLPKYSYDQLYQMIHKKSSSIVKWILYISLIEFAVWGALYFVIPQESHEFNKEMGIARNMLISSIVSLIIFLFFVGLFYYNYSKIKITDSVKELMRSILRTRQTVYLFIIWNIVSSVIVIIIISLHYSRNKEKLLEFILKQNPTLNIENTEAVITSFFISFGVTAVILIGVLLLLYRIFYMRLLKRLKSNYKQLQDIEKDM